MLSRFQSTSAHSLAGVFITLNASNGSRAHEDEQNLFFCRNGDHTLNRAPAARELPNLRDKLSLGKKFLYFCLNSGGVCSFSFSFDRILQKFATRSQKKVVMDLRRMLF